MSRSARSRWILQQTHPAETGNLLCKNSRRSALWLCYGIFNTPVLILLNLDCFFSLNNPNSPSPLTKPQNRQLDSLPFIPHICLLMAPKKCLYIQPISSLCLYIQPISSLCLYIYSQFLSLSGRYPFQKRCFMRHQGKEEVSGGDLYLNLRPYSISLLWYLPSREFGSHSSSLSYLASDLWWKMGNIGHPSWKYRLFLQFEMETVNFWRKLQDRRKNKKPAADGGFLGRLGSEKTVPRPLQDDFVLSEFTSTKFKISEVFPAHKSYLITWEIRDFKKIFNYSSFFL